ncbi:MAG: hypothetical protein IKN49_06515 [Elusimicrobiaceae bacterium]|nr:hypothetical protein [Elusimicrobiaceae bacterium]
MKKFIFYLLFLFSPALMWAQSLDITAQQLPQEGLFAQPIDMHIELAHTPGYTVQVETDSIPEGFTLSNQTQEVLSPGTVAYDLTVLPFTLGVSTFTAVNFQLLTKDGQVLATTSTQPQMITVKPVQYFKDKTLRDIRPPYIPTNWIWWLLCLLTLILIIYVARRFWKDTRKQTPLAQEIPDNRPADVIALSKIQLLLQSGIWEQAEYKLFYIELGNILREYYWRRFRLDVSSDTSAELLRRARTVPEMEPVLQLLRSYLNSADLVKFAKVTPSAETMHHDVFSLQSIVKKTTPIPQNPQEVK